MALIKLSLQLLRWEVRSESAKSFAAGLVNGTPISLAIQERKLSRESVVDAVAKRLGAVGGDRPFRSTMQAIVATAIAVLIMKMGSSQQQLRVQGVIPARMESRRLPGKAMLPICGRPMIHWVYERSAACPLLSDLCVATDSAIIKQYCLQNDIPVFLTASSHRSGTERIVELMHKIPADIFVNIQGDEPMIQSDHLVSLIEPFQSRADIAVSTLKTPLEEKDVANPNVVKVVSNSRGQALYFSRAALPYRRNSTVF